jgi:hypothetical protein
MSQIQNSKQGRLQSIQPCHLEKGNKMDSRKDAARHAGEQGISLIETMIATLITVVGLSAVLGLFAAGMAHSQTQGDVASRATTFSQDKMEELLALQFGDSASNTTVSPVTAAGGTGLCGLLAANASCGSVDTANALAGYVDYLDFQGTRVAAVAQASFMRQWTITANTANLKTITVRTTALRSLGAGVRPFTVLVSMKSRI